MKRRGWNESPLPMPSRPRSARRKPEWNLYLTDDSQYKLNQQQQLQRALQQLSTAHFLARSPAASASRRRLKAASTHSSAWSTPQDPKKSRERPARLADVEDTGELNTQRRLQFADVSLDLEEPTPRSRAARANTVSFQEQRMDPEHKATLQTELEVLEKMLWQLETETERRSWESPQKRSKSPRVVRTGSATKLKEVDAEEIQEREEIEPEGEDDDEEEEEDRGEEKEETDAETRLGDVCYKSLEIGLELTRRVDSLKKEFESERRLREDRELKIEMLEQEVRSTQAKCNYLEAKYQNMVLQVDGMREAVIATEEAIHRMTLAFEYSQRRRGKTSNPSTPSKPGVSRPAHANDVKVSKKAATPKKRSNDDADILLPLEKSAYWRSERRRADCYVVDSSEVADVVYVSAEDVPKDAVVVVDTPVLPVLVVVVEDVAMSVVGALVAVVDTPVLPEIMSVAVFPIVGLLVIVIHIPVDVAGTVSDEPEHVCALSQLSIAYNIGIGKTDITGPAADVVMMGFADPTESTTGILSRLYARAFLIEDPDTSKRIMFVHCDLMGVMQLVHQEVLAELATKYNGVYTEQNVVLHASHTHASPGGTAGYFLYDVTSLGYISENFARIVSGIVDAIEKAHNSMESGIIRWNKGEVDEGGNNRSPNAYLANPASERALYNSNIDTTMRALHFFSSSGKLRGVLAFYPVHPTSLTAKNRLISGDNKGYAEFLLEDELQEVTVAIGIANAGDVSPNRVDNGDGTFRGEGKTTIESAEIMGKRQYDTLSTLIKGPSELIQGSVVANLSYVDFSNVTLDGAEATTGNPYADRTCPAVVGQNFAAGTEDGRGPSMFTEGNLKGNALFKAIGAVIKPTPKWVQDCQHTNKVPLFAVGLMEPVPWVPNILPVQVVKIGQFAIAVTNFETTTMAGRRIRNTVKTAL
ncbi:hypothetical protein PC120_g8797, partial [Phytophthora cactorum]